MKTQLNKKVTVMGILNATPDSFSDGGKFNSIDTALFHTEQMIADGADVIDIGGETTKPGSKRISAEEELERVIPIVEAVKKRFDTQISIDTYKSTVAEEAIRRGVSIINDISGFTMDAKMPDIAVKYQPVCILMHMQGTPFTMQHNPIYEDVCKEVFSSLLERADFFSSMGIKKIILDPGFGFGKTTDDNYRLLAGLKRLAAGEYPVLVGASRKSMIGNVLSADKKSVPADERVAGTIAVHTIAILNGATWIRVHDVKEAVQAVKVAEKYMNIIEKNID